ncbi:MAG: HEPN domain-containing protein [Chloroflexota bacterium]
MNERAEEITANLDRAKVSISAAKDMAEKGYYDIAASRAYYAAFYAASALLLNEGMNTSRHSGVIASIHRLYVKEGRLDKELGKKLNWLFELRGVGDYGVSEHVASGDAYKAVQVAEEFVESAIRILGK